LFVIIGQLEGQISSVTCFVEGYVHIRLSILLEFQR